MTRSRGASGQVSAVVIGQGSLPVALLQAAQAIVPDTEGVVAISNLDCSTAELASKLEQAIDGLPDGDVIVFADMFGSSCANAGRDAKKHHPRIAVLCGTNLPMLVRFLYHRGRRSFAELVPFLVETGRSAVQSIKL
jgi:mannose/fructose-specific phosphotransferase system component IIA